MTKLVGGMPIQPIIDRNKEAGQHFFDRDTLWFFNGRYSRTYWGDWYFWTSEKPWWPDAERTYTVRQCQDNGSIRTVGESGEYSTRDQAIAAIKRIIRHGEDLA